MEVIKHLVRKVGFSGKVVEVVAADLRGSTAAIYQGKWSRFLYWCHGQNLSPCKATVHQVVEFFLNLRRELKLLVPAVKSYHVALNLVSSLASVDLAANHIICRIFRSFKKSCPPCEV